ncbi:MAG: hypothetical protein HZA28_00620 [Candidatus Omnitrophica bacterium]|nr:hypothetical protein [Candidatus Omnitrophota bacterium]
MTRFEKEYFRPFSFSGKEIDRYFQNALRDLKIAQTDPYTEVRFTYCYQALIKSGIALIAKVGQVKVRSVAGHHVQVLTKMSNLLNNPDILTIGNAMRMKRNLDLYSGGEFISKKETGDYIRFTKQVINQTEKIIKAGKKE